MERMREMSASVPSSLREIIGQNIERCRQAKFPGRGGSKVCAETFGVSPQQWSPWETGKRTPSSKKMAQLAEFFVVTVEYFYQNHSSASQTAPKTESTADSTASDENRRTPCAGSPPFSPASARRMPFFCPAYCLLLMEWPVEERRRILRLMEHFMGVDGDS
jgi:transcriptional regulator with XRE-family HTH domain